MTDIENSVAFTKNSDNSLTWKALSYTDEEGDFHEAILDYKGNPCSINVYPSMEGYELSNSQGEIYLPRGLNSIELLSVMEYMAQSESKIQELNTIVMKSL